MTSQPQPVEHTVVALTMCPQDYMDVCAAAMQVAEVVAQVLLQAQTDVLVEVAADPSSPPQGVESAVAEVLPAPCTPVTDHCLWHEACLPLSVHVCMTHAW